MYTFIIAIIGIYLLFYFIGKFIAWIFYLTKVIYMHFIYLWYYFQLGKMVADLFISGGQPSLCLLSPSVFVISYQTLTAIGMHRELSDFLVKGSHCTLCLSVSILYHIFKLY